jgi:hypothetical protein
MRLLQKSKKSPPPWRGRVRVGEEVAMKSQGCRFTHPLTPSRRGRGKDFCKSLRLQRIFRQGD